jgi:DNA-binding transcriptional LysR family regulator
MKHLLERNLIGFPTGWAMRALADRAVHRSGLRLDFNLEVNDTSTLFDLVAAGLGVTLIASALAAQRRDLCAVPLTGPPLTWTISALAISPRPTNRAALELWRRITVSSAEPRT